MSIIQAPDDVSDVLDSVELLGKGRPGIEDMIGDGEYIANDGHDRGGFQICS